MQFQGDEINLTLYDIAIWKRLYILKNVSMQRQFPFAKSALVNLHFPCITSAQVQSKVEISAGIMKFAFAPAVLVGPAINNQ
jgi:hypothetical protein